MYSTLFCDGSEQTTAYILGHLERDWYPQDGTWNLGKLQNKYYIPPKKKLHLQLLSIV